MPESTMTFTDKQKTIFCISANIFFKKLNIPADTIIDLLIGTEAEDSEHHESGEH